MAISSQLVAAIQAAGASVNDADTALKDVLKDYAEQLANAMVSNPFDVGNDALFEDWKTVARLSQSVARIEQEMRQIFETTSQLTGLKQLSAGPTPRIEVELAARVTEVDATDVIVKPLRVLKGNALSVFTTVKALLSKKEFRKLNISDVALTASVPKGSMSAALKRLMDDGYLVEGAKGHFKLTSAAK